MSMPINLRDVKSSTVSALDEGWYTVKCVAAKVSTAQSSGNDMIEAEFNIMLPEKYNKRKVWTNFALVANSLWKLKSFLDASKSKYADDPEADEKEIAANMVGSITDAYLEPDTTISGNPRNNIRNFREPQTAASASTSTPAAGGKKKMFE
jgi:hypothetical protein